MPSMGKRELDIHGMTRYQAQIAIDAALRRAGRDVYRIAIIHGYRSGSSLRDFVREEYKKHPKVLRVELGINMGVTELVLREY